LPRLFFFLACALIGTPAPAHDFWIQPSAFRVPPNAVLQIHLRVGHAFAGEPVARDPERIRRFSAIGPDGAQTPIPGRRGESPAGWVRLAKPGIHVIGHRTHRWVSSLEPALFEKYLREEGLEHVLAARSEKGEHGAPGREWYSRCAKSIVVVEGGEPSAYRSGFERALGMRLELIPETNPATLAPGEAFSLRLLFEGKPIPGILIRATHEQSPQEQRTARTDAHGRASFVLAQAGVWLFTGVHIIRAGTAESWKEGAAAIRPAAEADWESFWSSLTLAVADRP
jgi:uncharacterized GH25 family protein